MSETDKNPVRQTAAGPTGAQTAGPTAGSSPVGPPTASTGPTGPPGPRAILLGMLAWVSYVSLTTFRKSGQPVPTPVWIAPDGKNHLLVWTGAESGKVKRIRHTPRVTVAPCDRQGRLIGEHVNAHARILDADELPRVKAAMTAKYGLQFRFAAAVATVGRVLGIRRAGQVGLEITLD